MIDAFLTPPWYRSVEACRASGIYPGVDEQGSSLVEVADVAVRLDQIGALLTITGDIPQITVLTLGKGSKADPAADVSAVDKRKIVYENAARIYGMA